MENEQIQFPSNVLDFGKPLCIKQQHVNLIKL